MIMMASIILFVVLSTILVNKNMANNIRSVIYIILIGLAQLIAILPISNEFVLKVPLLLPSFVLLVGMSSSRKDLSFLLFTSLLLSLAIHYEYSLIFSILAFTLIVLRRINFLENILIVVIVFLANLNRIIDLGGYSDWAFASIVALMTLLSILLFTSSFNNNYESRGKNLPIISMYALSTYYLISNSYIYELIILFILIYFFLRTLCKMNSVSYGYFILILLGVFHNSIELLIPSIILLFSSLFQKHIEKINLPFEMNEKIWISISFLVITIFFPWGSSAVIYNFFVFSFLILFLLDNLFLDNKKYVLESTC